MAGPSLTHILPPLLLVNLMWQRCIGVVLEEAHPGLLSYGIHESCKAGAGWNGRFIDISHSYRPDMPKWDSAGGLGSLTRLVESIADGDLANVSEMKFENVHSGTHVDAPGHFVQEDYEHGDFHVASLDLNVLIGPVLLIDVPRSSNITAQVLENLHLPSGIERVVFRTLNTDRKLMWKKEFDSSYAGFTTDGAEWLVHHTDIKFVVRGVETNSLWILVGSLSKISYKSSSMPHGIDYLSIATYVDLAPAHRFLLGKRLIIVEGLNLDNVDSGLYTIHCLPIKVLAEGCPIRCLLSI